MSVSYRGVFWNPRKRTYDLLLALGVVLYLGAFVGLGMFALPNLTPETLLIRALGSCAFLMLHVVLSIGPLARLDPRFLPLLYNRRHFGVVLFLIALAHGGFSLVQFHAMGDLNPFVSVLVGNMRWDSVANFPFQPLGVVALIILFLMASTSHDFWLVNLSAPVWKRLHMMVYLAWALLVLHVGLGVLQAETSPVLAGLVGVGIVWVVAVHLSAAYRELARDTDASRKRVIEPPWAEVGAVDDIQEGRAISASLGGERVAIYRWDGKVAAVSGVCQHQNGPLAEGEIRGGCITCPWHGYEYRPEDGTSPPPFTEKVPVFRVRIVDGRVWVNPEPLPPGTRSEPAQVEAGDRMAAGAAAETEAKSTPGASNEPGAPPRAAHFLRPRVAALLALVPIFAAGLVLSTDDPDPKTFEWGNPRSFVGVIQETPVPSLLVRRPGVTSEEDAWTRYLLVGEGKAGAADEITGLGGKLVRLDGTLIYRDDRTMIEIVTGTAAPLEMMRADTEWPPRFSGIEDLGTHTLVGEIVDSKCYLGVMTPGDTKPHRACAIRCISGGIPPVFLVRQEDGRAVQLLLLSTEGRAVNREVLGMIAEPLEITGRVKRHDDLLVLEADLSTARRIRP